MNVKIEESWKEVLKDEFTKDYFLEIATLFTNPLMPVARASKARTRSLKKWACGTALISPFKELRNLLLASGNRLPTLCFPPPKRLDADA